jgi:hypothetical protein
MGLAGYAARTAVRSAVRSAQTRPAPARHPGTVAVPAAGPAATVAAQAVAPSSNPADGVQALGLLSRFHQHYDYWEAPEYADLLAAWELQCAAMEDDGSPIWRAVPRIIVAGMYGNGKSGTLDQIAMATGTTVLLKTTFAGIRDKIGKDRQVAILDDAQITFGAGKKSEDVRMMVNAHTKGRAVRDASGEVSAYGQLAMAGLSKMLTGKVAFAIEDTLSRCFVLFKARKPKGTHVPEVTDAAEEQVRGKLVPAMREWCTTYRDTLRERAAWFGEGNPTGLPDLGGGGRGNDQLARPLLAVCDVATALAHKAWRESGEDEADFPAEHNWSERIRRALIFVSGVPEPVEDEESPLDGVSAAFDQMWAGDAQEPEVDPVGPDEGEDWRAAEMAEALNADAADNRSTQIWED